METPFIFIMGIRRFLEFDTDSHGAEIFAHERSAIHNAVTLYFSLGRNNAYILLILPHTINGCYGLESEQDTYVGYYSYFNLLTHCGVVMPAIWRNRSVSTLTQEMTCCLVAPRYCLNQCWLIISVLGHSQRGISLGAIVNFILCMCLEITVLLLLTYPPGSNELTWAYRALWSYIYYLDLLELYYTCVIYDI